MARRRSMSPARRCFRSSRCLPACGWYGRSMPEQRIIAEDDDGIRLDRWFKRHFPVLTHGRLEKLLRKGEVRLDGKRIKAADRLIAGQTLRLPPQVIHDKAEAPVKTPQPVKTSRKLEDSILYM